MSNLRYIDIDSNHRDRNQFPSPANFTVEIAQSGTRNKLHALDPISNQAIQESWNGSFDNSAAAATVTLSAPPFVTGVATSSPTEMIISSPAGDLRTEEGFYNGSIISAVSGGVTYLRRITAYRFVTSGATDQALISVETAFPDSVLTDAAATGSISNPQDATDTVSPTVFIPNGKNISNFYVNCVITNRSRPADATRTITNYLFDTRLAILDSAAATWVATDDYTISKAIPCEGGYQPTVLTFTGANANGRIFQLPTTTASATPNVYAGGFLRIISLIAGGLPPAPFSAPAAPYDQSRRIVRYIGLDTTFSAVGGSAFTLNEIAEGIEQTFYVGAFITTAIATYEIATFNTTTRAGTITGVFGAEVVGATVQMRTVILESAFTAAPTIASTRYQIECFQEDNAVPFAFSGSLVSQSQMVCYEIELLHLILPNSTLNVGRGGRIAFYPYVYVELQNVSGSSSGNTNIIYSNNPSATKALFKASIDDTPTPLISPFIKIDGDGMVQTIKFNPNDSLRFLIRLPNGDIFSVEEAELFGPQAPNPLVQISALFSIKRL